MLTQLYYVIPQYRDQIITRGGLHFYVDLRRDV